MLTVKGIYKNGNVKLLEKITFKKQQEVIVTFLEPPSSMKNQKSLNLDSFNFLTAQKQLKNYKGSLCDALIEERRISLPKGKLGVLLPGLDAVSSVYETF